MGIAGLGAFIIVLTCAAALFARALGVLRSKTLRVVKLLLLLPQKISKTLKNKYASQLQNLIQVLEGLESDANAE